MERAVNKLSAAEFEIGLVNLTSELFAFIGLIVLGLGLAQALYEDLSVLALLSRLAYMASGPSDSLAISLGCQPGT